MYPEIFGVIDSYSVMLLLGVISSMVLLFFYLKHLKYNSKIILDLLLSGIVAVFFGVVFACLFQNLYEFCQNPSNYKFTFGLTFYGGLFGGVVLFLLMYFLYVKKRNGAIMGDILIAAPMCITIAHAFGRIGCFLAGCCYGKETTMWYGIYFPILEKKVIPTQLFEAIFLFILTIVLIFITFRLKFKYTFNIYLLSYSIFRFLIEFLRDDPRGGFLSIFSPSQMWSLGLFIINIPLYFFLRYYIFRDKVGVENENKG